MGTAELAELNINSEGNLWPEEVRLMEHVMSLKEMMFVFAEDQCGTFLREYFSDYIIPVQPHEPWELKNIPIPLGLRNKVIMLIKDKIKAGVNEDSQASYRLRWFCVAKKSGKVGIVHCLQPLNAISIHDSGGLPKIDEFVEKFAA